MIMIVPGVLFCHNNQAHIPVPWEGLICLLYAQMIIRPAPPKSCQLRKIATPIIKTALSCAASFIFANNGENQICPKLHRPFAVCMNQTLTKQPRFPAAFGQIA